MVLEVGLEAVLTRKGLVALRTGDLGLGRVLGGLESGFFRWGFRARGVGRVAGFVVFGRSAPSSFRRTGAVVALHFLFHVRRFLFALVQFDHAVARFVALVAYRYLDLLSSVLLLLPDDLLRLVVVIRIGQLHIVGHFQVLFVYKSCQISKIKPNCSAAREVRSSLLHKMCQRNDIW